MTTGRLRAARLVLRAARRNCAAEPDAPEELSASGSLSDPGFACCVGGAAVHNGLSRALERGSPAARSSPPDQRLRAGAAARRAKNSSAVLVLTCCSAVTGMPQLWM